MLFDVVIIDRVTVQVVVSDHFRVVESGPFFGPIAIHPFSSCLFATVQVGAVCRH